MIKKIKNLFRRDQVHVVAGNDLVFIPDVVHSVNLFGRRYLDFIFTESEIANCTQNGFGPSAHRLAARLAAKEAVMKILRPKRHECLPWKAIEVCRNGDGLSHIRLHPPATDFARRAGIDCISLTMSHEQQYASAVVIGTTRNTNY